MAAHGYSPGLKQIEQCPFGDDGEDAWGVTLYVRMFDNLDENWT